MEKQVEKQNQEYLTLYKYIRRYILQHGYAPTESEISTAFGSKKPRRTVERALQTLINQGLLSRVTGKKRSLRLSTEASPHKTLPITGKIAAGNPIQPIESNQVLDLTELLSGPDRFVLEVVGDSMQGDNICNGDYVICEHRDSANDGEIVVALINNSEVTLKRIQHNSDNTVTLLSSNAAQPPMIHKSSAVKIQGVYLGLIRLTKDVQEGSNVVENTLKTSTVK